LDTVLGGPLQALEALRFSGWTAHASAGWLPQGDIGGSTPAFDSDDRSV